MINYLKRKDTNSVKFQEAEKGVFESKKLFESAKNDTDTQQQALSNLRKSLKIIDELIGESEWPATEKELKATFYRLEEINKKKGGKATEIINKLRPNIDQAIREKDIKYSHQLIGEIESVAFELTRLENLIAFIFGIEQDFNKIPWRDHNEARSSINKAKRIIAENPNIEKLQLLVNDLFVNARFDEQRGDTSGAASKLLRG